MRSVSVHHARCYECDARVSFIAQDEHLAEWGREGVQTLTSRPLAFDDQSAGVLVTAFRQRSVIVS